MKTSGKIILVSKGVILLFLLWFFLLKGSALFASPKLRVVCTFYPLYLFTRNVVGDQADVSVELLLPPDMGCPHDYALTPGDIKKISRADLVIVNGLGLETFLSSAQRKFFSTIKIVEATHGGEPIRSHAEIKDDEHQHHNFNPHLFASPKMAVIYTDNIARALSLADSNGIYKKNAEQFIARLKKLDLKLRAAASEAGNKRVVIFHDSLEYLLRDAGLEITGIIQSKQLSAKEVVHIISEIKKNRPAAIFSDPQYSTRMVEMISRETKVPYYILDPVASGVGYDPGYYEAVMRKNIDTLRRALKE